MVTINKAYRTTGGYQIGSQALRPESCQAGRRFKTSASNTLSRVMTIDKLRKQASTDLKGLRSGKKLQTSIDQYGHQCYLQLKTTLRQLHRENSAPGSRADLKTPGLTSPPEGD